MDEADPDAARWHLRFANYKTALDLLCEGAAESSRRQLSLLEREGLIQRFEYTWELAWKAMRDYMLDAGISIKLPSPPNVIRAAFQLGLIEDGENWVRAKNDRNIVSQEYDLEEAERIASDIVTIYVPLMGKLEERLEDERRAGN